MQKLTEESDLKRMANTVRQDIIRMLDVAGSGHSGGPLGATDIAVGLYFNVLQNLDPKKKDDPDRDRLFVSAGHYAPVWYATLARAGFFPVEELSSLRKLGSRLQGHMDRLTVPGVESSAASLGQGLGIGCGSAVAARIDSRRYQTYVFMSDGEQDEGSIWEAAVFAGHYRLGNLTAIMDRNNIQIDGNTEDVMTKEPLREKYESFGWHVIDVDGNNIMEVIDSCQEARAIVERPVLILAHTIPGKGVDYMEGDYRWHGNPPGKKETERTPVKDKQTEDALRQLRDIAREIKE